MGFPVTSGTLDSFRVKRMIPWEGRVADERLRVLIADDHQLFRRGLRMVLEDEDDIEVVA